MRGSAPASSPFSAPHTLPTDQPFAGPTSLQPVKPFAVAPRLTSAPAPPTGRKRKAAATLVLAQAGETFYEPGGCLHRVSKNPGKVNTRVVAWVLHPRDAKEIVIPAKKK